MLVKLTVAGLLVNSGPPLMTIFIWVGPRTVVSIFVPSAATMVVVPADVGMTGG